MSRLVIEDQRGRKTNVPLARDSITIGREEGSTIRLNERNVSRVHLELRRDGDAHYVVDRSRYGSILNGERFTGPVRLANGDVILVGDYRLLIEIDGPPVERDALPVASVEFGFARLSRIEDRAITRTWRVRGPVILGSSPRAHILVESVGALRNHVRVHPHNGRWVAEVSDRASTFRANGHVCQRRVLVRGDVLRVGKDEFVWHDDNEFRVAVRPEDVGRVLEHPPRQRTWQAVGLCADGQAPPEEEHAPVDCEKPVPTAP